MKEVLQSSRLRVFAWLILSALFLNLNAQELKIKLADVSIFGTLQIPKYPSDTVCIIVPGSGDIDRDGNGAAISTDAYKLLAYELSANQVASFRYDKRGIGASVSANLKESDMRFETNVSDLKFVLDYLRSLNKFKHFFLIGHSEGSLVSILLAKNEKIDGLISVAGAAQNGGDLIIKQINSNPVNPEILKKEATQIIKKLQRGELTNDIRPIFEPLFRISVQPYLISWFKYEPIKEIIGLKIPILITHGDLDAQITLEDARELAAASRTQPKIIKNMTHMLKEIASPIDQLASYTDPSYKISNSLVENIVKFIKDVKAR